MTQIKVKSFFVLSILTLLVEGSSVHGTQTSINSNSYLNRFSESAFWVLAGSASFASSGVQIKSSLNYFGKPSILSTVLDHPLALETFSAGLNLQAGIWIGEWMGKKISGDFGKKVGAFVGPGVITAAYIATRKNPWAFPIFAASSLFSGYTLYSKVINLMKQEVITKTAEEQKKVAKKKEVITKTDAEQKKVTKNKGFQEVF